MFLRLAQLYRRYVHRHLCLSFSGGAAAQGSFGPVILRRGRVCVDRNGRILSDADAVLLEHGGAQMSGHAPSLPYLSGASVRVSLRNPVSVPVTFPALSRVRLCCAHLALWPGLLRRMIMVLPLLPYARAPHVRSRAKARLVLGDDAPTPVLHLAPPDAPLHPLTTGIAIVLPVHNAAPHVARCLDRIVTLTDLPWSLVIIEDGSTDASLRPLLQAWVTMHPEASLICHDSPRGFAGAVDAGLAVLGAIDRPVVVLNSDVTLPQCSASRLVAPLLTDAAIASVTPLSNEGELMGVPHPCAGVSLRNTEADMVDAALAPFARCSALPSLPTGSGFCMALSPQWMAKVPRFDEGFGRGYGEEVDLCQRTRARGARHVCQLGLFVGHVGAASFGVNQRRILSARRAPFLSRRWPRFDGEVAEAQANARQQRNALS